MRTSKLLPPEIVSEALSNFIFCSTNIERDIEITESLASNTYNNMDHLLETIKGYVSNKQFEKEVKDIKKSDFYKDYWAK